MTELARPDSSWLAYISPRVLPSTPLRARVAWALLADPCRSNRMVARDIGAVDFSTVGLVRHGLEDMGVIPVYRAPPAPWSARARPAPVRDRIRLALLADPCRPNRVVAEECETSHVAVLHARHGLERDGRIPVWRAPPWDTRMAGVR